MIDLTVKDFNEEGKSIVELQEILNDSDIPFLIEIQEFSRLPEAFQNEILKKYVQIFPMPDRAVQLTFCP